MKLLRTTLAAGSLAIALLPLAALAHEGHGPEGAHWHASDLLGLVLALVVAMWLWKKARK
jgi:hypothetical protein